MKLDELLGFATRANPRRGFLFVSKVLGKHIPCRPKLMRDVYERLATEIGPLISPAWVIGMAETATGLGAGVADSLSRRHDQGHIYSQHSTRHDTGGALWITFDESHSHAPDQLLYRPLGEALNHAQRARTLILVDDEITSGRTLMVLARALSEQFGDQLDELILVSIVSWLRPERREQLERHFSVPVRLISLFEGAFDFIPDPNFNPSLPGQVTALRPTRYARSDLGRCGIDPQSQSHKMNALSDALFSELDPDRPVTIVGTGEFAYQPFLLAEWLERRGLDVLYQSSTRSPILLGDAISESLTTNDEQGEGVSNYLHNPPHSERRQVIIAYESERCATNHLLPELLNARQWVYPEIQI